MLAYASVVSLLAVSSSLTLPASPNASRSLSKGKSKTPAKCKHIVYDDNSLVEDTENGNPSPELEVKRRSSRLASKGRRKKTAIIENLDSKEDPIGDKKEEGPKTKGRPLMGMLILLIWLGTP